MKFGGILITLTILSMITLVSASPSVQLDYGGLNSNSPYVMLQNNAQVNYSLVNVNNSQFLQGLTPQEVADLFVEQDPIYSANTYATGMNQGVATTDYPNFAGLYDNTGMSVLSIDQNNRTLYGTSGTEELLKWGTSTSNIEFPLAYGFSVSYGIDLNNGALVDSGGKRVDWINHLLKTSSGNPESEVSSLDWSNRKLYANDGINEMVDWLGNINPSSYLSFDSNLGEAEFSVPLFVYNIGGDDGVTRSLSVDPNSRQLYGSTGYATIDWNQGFLNRADSSTTVLQWGTDMDTANNQPTILVAVPFSDNSHYNSIDTANRQLYASDGTTQVMGWADSQLKGGINSVDIINAKLIANNVPATDSVDWFNRILYANDGTTGLIDYSNSGTSGNYYFSNGVLQGDGSGLTNIVYLESDPLSLHLDQTTPQTLSNVQTGTGAFLVIDGSGYLYQDQGTYLPTGGWYDTDQGNVLISGFNNDAGYISSEVDPIYSANTYAVGMDQGVATTDAPTFSYLTINSGTPGGDNILFATDNFQIHGAGLLSSYNSGNPITSIDVLGRTLYASDGSTPTMNWDYTGYGVSFPQGISDGASAYSIIPASRKLQATNGLSVDWENRAIYDTDGSTVSATWGNNYGMKVGDIPTTTADSGDPMTWDYAYGWMWNTGSNWQREGGISPNLEGHYTSWSGGGSFDLIQDSATHWTVSNFDAGSTGASDPVGFTISDTRTTLLNRIYGGSTDAIVSFGDISSISTIKAKALRTDEVYTDGIYDNGTSPTLSIHPNTRILYGTSGTEELLKWGTSTSNIEFPLAYGINVAHGIDLNNGALLESGGKHVDWVNYLLKTSSGNQESEVLSVDWSNRYLYDTTGTGISLDWNSKVFYTQGNEPIFDYSGTNAGSANVAYLTATHTGTASVFNVVELGHFGYGITDASYAVSIEPDNRVLKDTGQNIVLDWSQGNGVLWLGDYNSPSNTPYIQALSDLVLSGGSSYSVIADTPFIARDGILAGEYGVDGLAINPNTWTLLRNNGNNVALNWSGSTLLSYDGNADVVSLDWANRIGYDIDGTTPVFSWGHGDGSFVAGNSTGNLTINADGTPRLEGTATVWNDLQFPANTLKINPLTSKPDEDTSNVFLLFDDASTETVRATGQSSHTQMNNTPLYCHVHWKQEASGTVLWNLNYTLSNLGSTSETWYEMNFTDSVFTYDSGSLEQLSYFEATANNVTSPSAIFRFKLSRLGGATEDDYSGDAKFESFDCHYEIDKWGSSEEYA